METKSSALKLSGIILGVIVAGIILVVGFVAAPWLTIYIGGYLSPAPPAPETNYGEFPFKLVYEIDSEITTVEDTLVIEYKGVGWNEGLGKYNKWSVYWMNKKDSNEELADHTEITLFDGIYEGSSTSVSLELGSCEYYMGLEETQSYYEHFGIQSGDIVMKCPNYTGPISDEELYEKFGIKIIEKSVSKPIINP